MLSLALNAFLSKRSFFRAVDTITEKLIDQFKKSCGVVFVDWVAIVQIRIYRFH